MAITITELRVALRADNTIPQQIQQGVAAARAGAGQTASAMQQTGAAMTRMGASLSLGVTAPVIAMGRSMLKAAGDFEQVKSIFASTTQATSAQMRQVSDLSIKLGNDIKLPGVSATSAMQAMLELSKAGLSVNTSMQAARGALALAATEGIKHARAAEITANALNMFNLRGSDAGRVANLLAGAAAASSGGVTDMAVALRNGGAAFAGMKIPIDQFMASVGLLAKNGIQGSMAGTQLRQMMMRLAAPTNAAAAEMARLGISVHDSRGAMLPYRDIIANLQRSFSGLTDAERDRAKNIIFGKFAMQAATVVMKEGVAGYDAMLRAVNRQNAATTMAAARMQGYKGAVEQFQSSIETAQVVIGQRFLPALTGVINRASELITRFGSLAPAQQNAILGFVAAAAALGPLLIGLGSLITAIGTISAALPVIGAVLTGPVGLAIAGVTVAVVGLATAWRTNFGGIQGVVSGFVAAVAPMLAPIGVELRKIAAIALPFLRQAFDAHLPAMRTMWNGVWNVIAGTIRTVMAVVTGLVTAGLRLIQGDWRGALEALRTGALGAWGGIRQIFSGFLTWLRGWASGIVASLRLMGAQWIDGLVAGLRQRVGAALAAVRGFGQSVVATVQSVFEIRSPSRVFHRIGEGVIDGFVGGVGAAGPRARGAVRRVMSEAEKEARAFASLKSDVLARLREAQSGGTTSEQALAARVRGLTAAHREEITAIVEKTRRINEARAAREKEAETLRSGVARVQEMIRDTRVENMKILNVTPGDQIALEVFNVRYRDLATSTKAWVDQLLRARQELEATKILAQSPVDIDKIARGAGGLENVGVVGETRIGGTRPGPRGTGGLAGSMGADAVGAAASRQAIQFENLFRRIARGFERDLSQSFETLATRGIKPFFSSLLDSIKQTLLRTFADMAAQRVLQQILGTGNTAGSAAGGALGGMLGGISKFLPQVGIGMAVNSLLGNPLKKVGKLLGFKDGGYPPIGEPFVVGEQGPEVVVSGAPSRVIPNHQIGRAGPVTLVWNQHGPIQHEADENRVMEKATRLLQDRLRMAF